MSERPVSDRRRGLVRATAAIVIGVLLLLVAMFAVGNITQATISPTPTPNLSFLTPRPTFPRVLPTLTHVVQPAKSGTPVVRALPTATKTTAAKPTATR
jgi:hypothetical protein